METRHIFVDSSIFIGQNYNYQNAVFERLAELVSSGQACVLVSDIVVREVRAHIGEDVAKAKQASAKFKKDARILRNLEGPPYSDMFSDLDEEATLAALNAQLDNFLESLDVTTLPASSVGADKIFDRYFDRHPPFGDGKKKSEFPDAFNIEALETWCQESGEKVYVISTDPDLKATCEQSEILLALEKVSEFVNLVQYHDDVLTPGFEKKLGDNLELVSAAIEEGFEEIGFWLDDQDGEVDEVKVIEVEPQELLVLQVTDDTASADIPVRIKFVASVTYDDMDTAFWDSEEKIHIPRHTIRTDLEREEFLEAVVTIRHDVNDAQIFEVEGVEFPLGSPYGMGITTADPWDYR